MTPRYRGRHAIEAPTRCACISVKVLALSVRVIAVGEAAGATSRHANTLGVTGEMQERTRKNVKGVLLLLAQEYGPTGAALTAHTLLR